MTLNPNLKPNLYEISWNCKIQKLCLGQLMNTTLLISNLRQMRTYATAITACSAGKERSYPSRLDNFTGHHWFKCRSITRSHQIWLLHRIQRPKCFWNSRSFQIQKKVFGFSATSCLLEILPDTLLFDLKPWKNARFNRNQSVIVPVKSITLNLMVKSDLMTSGDGTEYLIMYTATS